MDLSRRGSFEWLERGLGLQARKFRATNWPFLDEIREALRKRRESLKARAPVLPNILVALNLRGIEFLVRNNLKAIVVAFRKDSDVQGDLRKLFVALVESAGDEPAAELGAADAPGVEGADDGDRRALLENLEVAIRADVMADLRKHPQCESVSWVGSRCSFLVKRKGAKKRIDCFAPNLKRRRTEFLEEKSDEAELKALYGKALATGLRVLEAEPSAAAAEAEASGEEAAS